MLRTYLDVQPNNIIDMGLRVSLSQSDTFSIISLLPYFICSTSVSCHSFYFLTTSSVKLRSPCPGQKHTVAKFTCFDSWLRCELNLATVESEGPIARKG